MSDAFGHRGYPRNEFVQTNRIFRLSSNWLLLPPIRLGIEGQALFKQASNKGSLLEKSILARLKHHFWRIFWLEKMLLYLLSKLIKEDHFACKTTRMSELLASPRLSAVHSKGPSHTSSRLSDYSFAKELTPSQLRDRKTTETALNGLVRRRTPHR